MRRTGTFGQLTGIVAAGLALAAPSFSSAAIAPVNDNYLSSLVITQASTTGTQAFFQTTQDTAAATTQADLFDPLMSGTQASGGGPEPTTCDGVSYGKTVWYDLRPRLSGEVEFDTAGFGSAISIYDYSTTTSKLIQRIACRVSRGLENNFTVPFDLQRGNRYTVQIGGLKTPTGVQGGPLAVKMTWYTDRDDDTVLDVLDKCPTLPGVDRYGGCPPTIHPFPRFSYDTQGTSVRLTLLQVDQIPAGATATVRCQKCGLTQTKRLGAHQNSATFNAFNGKLVPVGDTIKMFVTERPSGTGQYRYGAIGSYISYTVKNHTLANRVLRCLMPGSATPRKTCPPGGKHNVPSPNAGP